MVSHEIHVLAFGGIPQVFEETKKFDGGGVCPDGQPVHCGGSVAAALPTAKRADGKIWMAETTARAEDAFDAVCASYKMNTKRPRNARMRSNFSRLPAEHWKHLRTANPSKAVRGFDTINQSFWGIPSRASKQAAESKGSANQSIDRAFGQSELLTCNRSA
jgi:hypothetical protein